MARIATIDKKEDLAPENQKVYDAIAHRSRAEGRHPDENHPRRSSEKRHREFFIGGRPDRQLRARDDPFAPRQRADVSGDLRALRREGHGRARRDHRLLRDACLHFEYLRRLYGDAAGRSQDLIRTYAMRVVVLEDYLNYAATSACWKKMPCWKKRC